MTQGGRLGNYGSQETTATSLGGTHRCTHTHACTHTHTHTHRTPWSLAFMGLPQILSTHFFDPLSFPRVSSCVRVCVCVCVCTACVRMCTPILLAEEMPYILPNRPSLPRTQPQCANPCTNHWLRCAQRSQPLLHDHDDVSTRSSPPPPDSQWPGKDPVKHRIPINTEIVDQKAGLLL